MGAGAEGQARVQPHHEGPGRRRHFRRDDGQPLAEPERFEVLEPLALPNPVCQGCDRPLRLRHEPLHGGEHCQRISVAGEQADDGKPGPQRRSPGAGSSTGTSAASRRVTEAAPAPNSASSAWPPIPGRRWRKSPASRPARALQSWDAAKCSPAPRAHGSESEPLLEVVDIRPARLEGAVAEDFLVQRDVRANAFDDDLGQRAVCMRAIADSRSAPWR
jgi:hypothetical protein